MGVNDKAVAENKDGDKNDGDAKDGNKTRKKSDKDMNNYRKIVIADDTEARTEVQERLSRTCAGSECQYQDGTDVCVDLLREGERGEAIGELS